MHYSWVEAGLISRLVSEVSCCVAGLIFNVAVEVSTSGFVVAVGVVVVAAGCCWQPIRATIESVATPAMSIFPFIMENNKEIKGIVEIIRECRKKDND